MCFTSWSHYKKTSCQLVNSIFKWLSFSGILSKEDNRSLLFAVSADSTNHQLSLEYLNVSGLRSILLANYSLADGQCHHVAVVLFSSTIQLYIDTQLIAEEITYQNLWNRSGSIFLGGAPNASQDQYFKGIINGNVNPLTPKVQ